MSGDRALSLASLAVVLAGTGGPQFLLFPAVDGSVRFSELSIPWRVGEVAGWRYVACPCKAEGPCCIHVAALQGYSLPLPSPQLQPPSPPYSTHLPKPTSTYPNPHPLVPCGSYGVIDGCQVAEGHIARGGDWQMLSGGGGEDGSRKQRGSPVLVVGPHIYGWRIPFSEKQISDEATRC